MEKNRFLEKDFLIKVGIVAGIVLVLVLAIVLIVVLSGGGNDSIYGKNGEKIEAYPKANQTVTEVITKISLKGFVEEGGNTYALFYINEGKTPVLLAVGEKVMDVTLTAADSVKEEAVLSVSGTEVKLTLSSPLANIQR